MVSKMYALTGKDGKPCLSEVKGTLGGYRPKGDPWTARLPERAAPHREWILREAPHAFF